MTLENRFTLRLSDQDRNFLDDIANWMDRNPSDAIRRLIRNAATQIYSEQEPHQTKNLEPAPYHFGVNNDLT